MRAAIHETAHIHPTAIVGEDVSIGEGTVVGPFCVLSGPLSIGKNTRIGPSCVLGGAPEHRTSSSVGRVVIGDRNVLREGVVITHGTGERDTSVGSDCYFMHGAHVSHDCVVGDAVTLAHSVVLAGHVRIHDGANLGSCAAIHQRVTVGAFAMVGMGAVVLRDVEPFVVVAGVPARRLDWNSVGLSRNGIDVGSDGAPIGVRAERYRGHFDEDRGRGKGARRPPG